MTIQKTGPISAKGKARSSMNALKHGYTSRRDVIDGETELEFRQHMNGIYQSYPIIVPAQKPIVEEIGRVLWRMQRLSRLVENNVHAVSAEPVSHLALDVSFSRCNIDGIGPVMPLAAYGYAVNVDSGMLLFLGHQKIIKAIELWEQYQAGEDISTSELIDLMPNQVRDIFDQQAYEKSMLVDDYLESPDCEEDQEIINKQLRILRRNSMDYINQNPSDRLKMNHWESAKSLRVFETYNQTSYQRCLITNERSLNQLTNHYRQLCTMHVDQVEVRQVAKRPLKNEVITDVDVTD